MRVKTDRIDYLADELDDRRRTADKILIEPPAGVDPNSVVKRLKRALDDAVAADDLVEQIRESAQSPATAESRP